MKFNGSDSKESACNAEDLGSVPGSRRSPGEGNGNPLQDSCLGNPMDRRAWWATVHGVAKSWTWLIHLNYTVMKCSVWHIVRNITSVQFSHTVVSDSLWLHGLQRASPSPTPGACSNSCPLSLWCHPTISSSVIPFSSCFQSFPASGSFPMTHFFESGILSIGVSDSASILPMSIRKWFPLG